MENSRDLGELQICSATCADLPVILSFIRKLADYEHLTHEVAATEELLRASLFSARPAAEVAIAHFRREPIGFVLFFQNYSTFLGRPGIYIEDLFIDEPFRRRGFGTALLRHVAHLAEQRECGRLEWSVLQWNEPAIRFYQKLGAVPLSDWTVFRATGSALRKLAAGAD